MKRELMKHNLTGDKAIAKGICVAITGIAIWFMTSGAGYFVFDSFLGRVIGLALTSLAALMVTVGFFTRCKEDSV